MADYVIVVEPGRGEQGPQGIQGDVSKNNSVLTGTTTAEKVFAGTRTGLTGIARYHAAEEITAHAHYGFLDDSIIDYSVVSATQAHASFNDNARIQGIQNSNHHHSFQSYPHYDNTGTLGRMSGFWMQPDVTAGIITELSEFKAANPLGTGVITNLYGLYVDSLTRGVSNYAIYTAGTTPSRFGGPIHFSTSNGYGSIGYNPDTGNLDITPRTGYGLHLKSNDLILGPSAYTSIKYDVDTGNTVITPRTGYSVALPGMPVYANNSAAIAGGLVVGAVYQTSTGQLMIVY
jgi:hypothetical protein